MTGPSTTYFVLGFVVGGMVFWNVSVAVERFRRARSDFAMTRRGLRTLVEMMVNRGVQAVKGLLLAALTIVAVVAFWQSQR
jgi:hypothetical protein